MADPRRAPGDIQGILQEEIRKERKDTPFLVLISLLSTLALARAFVITTGAAEAAPSSPFYVGRNLIVGGYHIHHFFYGFVLICVAAWLAIQYPTRHLPRIAAVIFGAGLGLTIDEMGYFLGGQVNYYDRTTEFIALTVVLILLSALTFRSFREATREDLRALRNLRPRGIAALAILQILVSLGLLVGGLVLVAAGSFFAELAPSEGVLALGTFLILLGVGSFGIAWGLWTLRPWARTVAVVFAVVVLATDVVSVFGGDYAGSAVGVVIDALLLWYLTRPGVKAAFTRAPGAATNA